MAQAIPLRLWSTALVATMSLLPLSGFSQSAPVAANDLFYTTEGFSVPLTVLANDTDPDNDIDTSTLTVITPALHGITTIDYANGIIYYFPNPYYNGIDEFRYRVSDTSGLSNSAQVTLFVYPVNNPPVLQHDIDSTLEGTSVYVRVVANDDDPLDPLGNINPFSLSLVTPPNHGVAAAISGPLGRVFYTPNPGYSGIDSFEYSVCDDGHPLPGICGTAWAYVNVRARVVASEDKVLCPGDSVRLTATGPGPYTWSPPDGLSCTNCNAPYASPSSTTLYTVTSTAGGCCPNSDDILVTVYAPGIVQAVTDNGVLNEDGSTSVDVLSNDLLVSGYEFYPVSPALHGTASLDGSGLMTYTPAANYYGNDSASYAVCAPACPGSCDTGWVVFTVVPVNDPPLALADTASTDEDVSVLIDVLANDSDPDAAIDSGSVSISTLPIYGNVSVNPINGEIIYTHDADFIGTDSFYYQVCDTGFPLPPACSGAWVVITITEINDPIIAVDDAVTTFEDNTIVAFVLNNDMDPEARMDTSSLTLLSGPFHGTALVFTTTGGIQYDPDANYYGLDTIQYRICDDQVPSTCADARVAITVLPVNDLPLTVEDITVTDEEVPVNVSVLDNDSDIDGNLVPGSVSLISGPLHGSAVVDALTGEVIYTPAPDFFGTDSILYSVCDDGFPAPGICEEGLLVILVIPVNDSVSALDDALSVMEDTPTWLDVLANDSDPDGVPDPASLTITSSPGHGTTVVNPATGQVQFSPDLNYFGPDSFRYSVCDDGFPAGCGEALVVLDILPVNDAPVALDDTLAGLEDVTLNFNPLVNDSDLDGNLLLNNLSLLINPLNGTIQIDTLSGICQYIPDPGFFGIDSAQYQICDDGYPLPAECASAWIYIQLDEVPPLPNLAPIANDDVLSTLEDALTLIPVLANDTDPDGALVPGSVAIIVPATQASTAVDVLSGIVQFTPFPNVNGPDSFAYMVCDNGPAVLCDTAWVYILVEAVNDAPVAVDDFGSTGIDTAISIDILLNDSDIDGLIDPFSANLVSGPLNGTANYNPGTGVLTYTPNAGFSGVDSLIYSICDNGTPVPPVCDTALVVIAVGVVILPNAPPVAVNDYVALLEDESGNVAVWENDLDPEDLLDTLSITLISPPSNGSVSLSGGTAIYVPNPNFYGLDSLAYQICDAGSPVECAIAWVIFDVLPVNDAPLALSDSVNAFAGIAVAFSPLDNDTDLETSPDPGSLALIAAPVNGSVVAGSPAGTLIYTSVAGFTGLDSMAYQVCDSGFPLPALCDTAWVYFSVEWDPTINQAPLAADDLVIVLEDEFTDIFPLGNDLDPDGELDTASLQILVTTANGTAVAGGVAGAWRYTPFAQYNGPDSLQYRIADLGSPVLWDTAWVSITVLPVADAPVAVDDFSDGDRNAEQTVEVLLNDTDPDGDLDPSSLTILSTPENGSLSSGIGGVFLFTPDSGWCGEDSFQYQICDLSGLCAEATVYLQVSCYEFYAVDDLFTVAADLNSFLDVLANDAADARQYCLEIIQDPAHGTALAETNGTIDYRSLSYFVGEDSLRYRVCNATGLEVAEATVYLRVFYDGLLPAGGLSPNGDGKNDVYRILGLEQYPDHTLTIVNRWGDEVYKAAPYGNDWDGQYQGKALPEGTYFYILTLDPDDSKAVLSGAITLRR